jgi:hypothetical protein
MDEVRELKPADVQRRAIRVLLDVAKTEQSIAATFDRLAASGRPAYRRRRMEFAHAAWGAAEAARLMAEEFASRLR